MKTSYAAYIGEEFWWTNGIGFTVLLAIPALGKAGELGFEPSFLTSTSPGDDTVLTLENLDLQAVTIQPAPINIIAVLG